MDTASRYDSYWRDRDEGRTRARSRSRAFLALRLLEEVARDTTASSPARLYEIGCGPGWALEVFREAGFEVGGCDVSPAAVDRARELGLEVSCRDVENGPVADAGQDVIVALEVLEHLEEPLPVLREMCEATPEGGRLVVSLPNEYHLVSRLAKLVGRSNPGDEDDPHLHHFGRSSAQRLFEAAGLEVLGRLDDSIVPPRLPVLRWLFRPLLAVLPGFFSLAHVFLLSARVEVETP